MSKSEKYILVSLEDERSKKIAESISNKTARKVLDYLSTKEEAGTEEISKKLNLPISTIDYNLKNLKKAGLVETKHFEWSQKGKRIVLYSVAKKLIVIAPKLSNLKKELKNIIPLVGIAAVISIIIQYFSSITRQPMLQAAKSEAGLVSEDLALNAAQFVPTAVQQTSPSYGLWFFFGALFIIVVYLLIKVIRQKE